MGSCSSTPSSYSHPPIPESQSTQDKQTLVKLTEDQNSSEEKSYEIHFDRKNQLKSSSNQKSLKKLIEENSQEIPKKPLKKSKLKLQALKKELQETRELLIKTQSFNFSIQSEKDQLEKRLKETIYRFQSDYSEKSALLNTQIVALKAQNAADLQEIAKLHGFIEILFQKLRNEEKVMGNLLDVKKHLGFDVQKEREELMENIRNEKNLIQNIQEYMAQSNKIHANFRLSLNTVESPRISQSFTESPRNSRNLGNPVNILSPSSQPRSSGTQIFGPSHQTQDLSSSCSSSSPLPEIESHNRISSTARSSSGQNTPIGQNKSPRNPPKVWGGTVVKSGGKEKLVPKETLGPKEEELKIDSSKEESSSLSNS